LGHSCFRIKGSHTTVITDPYSPNSGYSLGKQTARIVTISHQHPEHSFISGIGGEPRESLQARRQSAYEHETDAVFCQDFDDPLGVEWGGLSHDAPPPGNC